MSNFNAFPASAGPQPDHTRSRLIDLMSNFGFKKVFKENRDNLLLLLNCIIPDAHITEVTVEESENLGEEETDRSVVFDVLCTTRTGTSVNIEVQKSSQKYFGDRAVYYSSRIISRKGEKGSDWDYRLTPTYFIGITSFSLPGLAGRERFRREYLISEIEEHDHLTEAVRFIFLEMPKFRKAVEDCTSDAERLFYLLRNSLSVEDLPEGMERDENFRKILTLAERNRLSNMETKEYNEEMKYGRDVRNMINYAREQGVEAGIEQGLAEGKAEGLAEGKSEVALRLKSMGLPAETIAEATGLSAEQIEGL